MFRVSEGLSFEIESRPDTVRQTKTLQGPSSPDYRLIHSHSEERHYSSETSLAFSDTKVSARIVT